MSRFAITSQWVICAALSLLPAASAYADSKPFPPLIAAKTVQFTETTWYRTAGGLQPLRESQVQMVIPVPGTAVSHSATPIRLRIEIRPVTHEGKKYVVAQPSHPSILVTDGTTKWEYDRPDNVFRHDKINPKKFYGDPWMSQWNFEMPTFVLFCGTSQGGSGFSWFKSAGLADVDGRPMRLYRFMNTNRDGETSLEKLWVDPSTRLPVRYSSYSCEKGKPPQENERFEYRNWILNKPIPGDRFSWSPPPSAKEYVPFKRIPLLADDAEAPDFTVQDKAGQALHLSDYKGKIVVLDFWATWCGPCQLGMRRTLPVAKKYAGKDVVFLAVNVWDKKAAFDAWLPQNPQYASMTFAFEPLPLSHDVAALYHVTGIPTQYVIDKEGKIVAGLSGFGGLELETAIQAANGERSREGYRQDRAQDAKMMEDMQ